MALRLALRDLRASGRRLWLLALCLFIGTAAIAGIGSLSSSILSAIAAQSREMLGGDLELRVSQRRASVEEGAAFAAQGRLSETVTARSMAHASAGGEPVLVTLKAVDGAWPLVGRLTLQPGATAGRAGGRQALIAPLLAERLGLRVGQTFRVGAGQFTVAGLIDAEPGAVGGGLGLGPSVVIGLDALDATGTIQPGSLYESRYRLVLPPGRSADLVEERLLRAFPGAGWTGRTSAQAAQNLQRGLGQLGQFLLLVGLASLAIAALGVGSGVTAYLAAKTRMIATLKVLGARSGLIARAFLIELGLVAGAGVIAGLALGALVPWVVAQLAGSALPVPPRLALYPAPLATAAALSLSVALLAALPALARARSVSAGALLRDGIAPAARPSLRLIAGMAALLALIAALAVGTAQDPRLAAIFLAATGALLVALWGVGRGTRALLARLPRPKRPLFRLALANLHRPGAQTDRLVIALGLGFSMFVALAVIDTSLSSELRNAAPTRAPRFFVIDLQPEDRATFAAAVAQAAPAATIETAPSLRGSIVALKGRSIADMKAAPDSWVLRGDRTITWSATVPPRNSVVAGKWWPPGYRGPPLVSLEEGAARALRLRVGDEITLAVLGVDVPARVAALRKVDWGGLGLNFAIVFSPGYIEEAPHSLLASVYAPPGHDAAISTAVARKLPSITLVRTGEVIEQVSDVLGQIALAVRAAAGVTIVAGIVVLIGAVAASAQARRYDTVLLKLLGASRRQLLLGQALEFGLLSAVLIVIAVLIGASGGWYVTAQVLELPFAPDPFAVALVIAAAAGLTLLVGLLGTRQVLRVRPAQALRTA